MIAAFARQTTITPFTKETGEAHLSAHQLAQKVEA